MAGIFSKLGSALGLTTERVPAKPYSEQGVSGFSARGGYIFAPETNADVAGPNRWHTAADILTNISIVAASVRYSLNLISRPKWRADPPSDKAEAKAMAEFVEEVIEGVDTSWSRIVRRGAMYRYHGFGLHEWVAKKRDDGKIGIQSVEVRPTHTIRKWDIDENGGVLGVIQANPQNGREIYLPRQKLVYLVDDALTDRPDGLGWFRHLAEPAQRLRRYLDLETMGFERDLAGIPVGRAPLQRINQMVKDGRLKESEANEMIAALENFVKIAVKKPSTGLLLDSEPFRVKTDTGEQISSVMQWGMELLTGSPTSSAELGNAIHRLMTDMALIIGTEQLLVGTKGEGSRALSEDKSRNLYLTSNATLGDMAEAFDRDIVTTLWTLNGFPDELRPKLRTEDVSFKDANNIAKALADLAAAGAILHPNDPAVNDLRDLMGISPAEALDESTADLMLGAQAGIRPEPTGGGGNGGGRPSRENPGGPGGKAQPTQKYSPDQPRDYHGRWTEDGAGAGFHIGSARPGKFMVGKLTDAERAALGEYTGDGYEALNKAVRDGAEPPEAKALDAAIAKGQAAEDMILYRGVTLTPDQTGPLALGTVLEDRGYVSATYDPQTASMWAGLRHGDAEPTVLRIQTRKGSTALLLDDFATLLSEEHEVLLPRGSQMLVLSEPTIETIGDRRLRVIDVGLI